MTAGEQAPQPLKMLLTTKRIHDPELIPSLIDSDINFGAVKVGPQILCTDLSVRLQKGT